METSSLYPVTQSSRRKILGQSDNVALGSLPLDLLESCQVSNMNVHYECLALWYNNIDYKASQMACHIHMELLRCGLVKIPSRTRNAVLSQQV